MKLNSMICKISELTPAVKDCMFTLMDLFYENMDRTVFDADLVEKDYCILLSDELGVIRGFTTQKIMQFCVQGKMVHGVFSGDTIIEKAYWGSLALFQEFARFYFKMGEAYSEFYWFLICKGYKTYRLLPLAFEHFYPCRQTAIPSFEKAVMDAYASMLYAQEYVPASGIIHYHKEKDCLRTGVADITEKELKNKDTAFFKEANPGYIHGDDLVCLTRLHHDNLRKGVAHILLGG